MLRSVKLPGEIHESLLIAISWVSASFSVCEISVPSLFQEFKVA